jgi:triacylglycerol lipase
MPRRIPYSRDPDDLLHPGRATDFFDPSFGPIPSDAALCSEMARLAYVRHEEGDGRTRLEGFLHRAGFELGTCVDAAGTQGFLASRAGGGDPVTVVAFRGTEPDRLVDLFRDLDALPSPGTGGGRVHRGFAKALDAVGEPVRAAALEAPGRLVFAGHSLGAAIALLAAGLVPAERRNQTSVYTFGCPRVGNKDFVSSLAWLSHFRCAGACDLVSLVPPVSLFPFVHHGAFHCIDREGTSHECGLGEQGHTAAKSFRAPCGFSSSFLLQLFPRLLAGKVPLDALSDHAPINYTSALWALR